MIGSWVAGDSLHYTKIEVCVDRAIFFVGVTGLWGGLDAAYLTNEENSLKPTPFDDLDLNV